MSYPTCNHLKEDGVYCASPALHNQNFCYFHLDIRARRLQMARTRMRGESCRLQLPVLEDMHAVQIALTQVLDALADDRIDPKRAGLMLYALQQSATNLNSTPGWKGNREQVEYTQPMRALEVPDVATQYDLPKGVDLDLPPEAALQAAEQPADPSQTPKQHVRLARMPQRAASRVDNYYHIPKKLGREKGYDEETYETARMLFDIQEAEREAEAERADDERRSRPSPPTGSFVNPGRNLAVPDVA
jgi:hypothetical protein